MIIDLLGKQTNVGPGARRPAREAGEPTCRSRSGVAWRGYHGNSRCGKRTRPSGRGARVDSTTIVRSAGSPRKPPSKRSLGRGLGDGAATNPGLLRPRRDRAANANGQRAGLRADLAAELMGAVPRRTHAATKEALMALVRRRRRGDFGASIKAAAAVEMAARRLYRWLDRRDGGCLNDGPSGVPDPRPAARGGGGDL